MKDKHEDEGAKRARREWERPTLKPVGTLSAVLKGGEGKITVVTGDPGEPQKVKPTG